MSICYICLAGRAIRRAVLCTRKEGDGIVSYIVLSIFSSLHFHYGLLYASIALGAKTTSMACDGYFIADVQYLSILAELLNSSNVLCLEYGFFLTFSFLPDNDDPTRSCRASAWRMPCRVCR